ncbi:MAG: Ig-like domain-containing protein, partial [Bryobacteraceae bacterium]
LSGLNKVSGDDQSVLISTAFPKPLAVKVVDAQNAPVQGVAVAFTVTSGTATLSAASATTGADGTASVNATAGSTPGTILVKASIGAFSVTFSLTARLAGPEVPAAGIVNGAGGQAGVVPGGIVTIYGKGIAPNLSGSITGGNLIGPLPLKLADVEVLFGSTAAPIYNVSNIDGMESVSVQAPFELGAPGKVNVTVKVAGASTVVPDVPTYAIQPGLFETLSDTGVRYSVAIGDDGRYLGPGQGARPGETVRLFVTGVGQTTPATGTNHAGIPGQKVAANLIVGFNNEGVRVISAEYMVGVVGVYIVSFEVPSSATSGGKPLVVAAVAPDGAGLIYSNPSTLTVQ